MPRAALRNKRSSRPPRQARAHATVDAILVAAARVVARDGYERAKVADIAERAGVSVGSIYQYFPSKDALVSALIQAHLQRGWELFLLRIEALGALSIRVATRALVATAVDTYRLDPQLFKVIFDEIPRRRATVGLPDFTALLVDQLATHLAARPGVRRRERLNLALRLLVTAVVEVLASMTADDPTLAQANDIVDELSDLATRYLLVDDVD